tara:strand:+ start:480 stop:1010 length:531 start_codon:yes stop_codon:yes gene_type:complete
MSELRVDKIYPKNGLPSGSGGGIVQVKYVDMDTMRGPFNGNYDAYSDITGLSLSFTPQSASNLIYIRTTFNVIVQTDQSWDEAFAYFGLFNGSTVLNESGITNRWGNSSSAGRIQCDVSLDHWEGASSTNARTYNCKAKIQQNGYYCYVCPDYVYATGGSREMNNHGYITVMEVSG